MTVKDTQPCITERGNEVSILLFFLHFKVQRTAIHFRKIFKFHSYFSLYCVIAVSKDPYIFTIHTAKCCGMQKACNKHSLLAPLKIQLTVLYISKQQVRFVLPRSGILQRYP